MVASLLAVFLVVTVVPAAAQGDPLSADEARAEAAAAAVVVQSIESTREFWSAAEVSPQVQRRLEAGLREGELPESMLSGSVPVETVSTRQDGNQVDTALFSDGSVTRTLVQEESGAFDPSALGMSEEEFSAMASYNGSIKSCKVFSGTGFARREDCAVSGSNGAGIKLGFIADYTLVQGAYNDKITARHTAYQQCNGAVCDAPAWNRWVKEESASRSAMVSMTTRWEVVGVSSGTAELRLIVGKNVASARLSV
ncbi:hypothetical protein [Promicromonospora sukumoe]|uniref:hypothetical protein n=1 Tax=Promicromonospora sukumoe TaxID=88382 RepID=UPI0003744656|nr:hypothetical protein [Promicromonospora sukumoe]